MRIGRGLITLAAAGLLVSGLISPRSMTPLSITPLSIRSGSAETLVTALPTGPLPTGRQTQRLAVLSRGANISTLFEANRDLSLDLSQIAKDGFRHVRVFVILEHLNDPVYLHRLDRLVDAAVERHLGIILTMSSPSFADDQHAREQQDGWQLLAQRYALRDPDLIFFELANEPTMDGHAWEREQEQIRQTVRRRAPDNTIILVGSPLSMVWSLPESVPADDNVIYAFHLYQPMIVTHQGADWDPQYKPFRGLAYPPDPANIKRLTDAKTAEALKQYAAHGRSMLQREIDQATHWSTEHNMPVMVTEFGVFGAAPAATRAAWLAEARQRMQAGGIGWTIWEYQGGFGIAPVRRGGAIAQALGLN